jgi:predicted RNA-binding protein with PIN domain
VPLWGASVTSHWILVDGYSVLHAWLRFATRKARQLSLRQRRDALVGLLRQYADHSRRRVTVVFDGYAAKHQPEMQEPAHGVEVLFSERGKTADDLIERLVGQSQHKPGILVVTSDNMERHTVEALGAQTTSAEVFEAEVESSLRELAGEVRSHSRRRIGHRREDWER